MEFPRDPDAEAFIFNFIEDLTFADEKFRPEIINQFLKGGHPLGIGLADLKEALERLGYVEGQILSTVRRFPEIDPNALELCYGSVRNVRMKTRLSGPEVCELLSDPRFRNLHGIFYGDEIWLYSTPANRHLLVGRGYLLVRGGQSVAYVATVPEIIDGDLDGAP